MKSALLFFFILVSLATWLLWHRTTSAHAQQSQSEYGLPCVSAADIRRDASLTVNKRHCSSFAKLKLEPPISRFCPEAISKIRDYVRNDLSKKIGGYTISFSENFSGDSTAVAAAYERARLPGHAPFGIVAKLATNPRATSQYALDLNVRETTLESFAKVSRNHESVDCTPDNLANFHNANPLISLVPKIVDFANECPKQIDEP